MKKIIIFIVFGYFLPVLLGSQVTAQADSSKPILEDIKFDSSSDQQERISFKLNGAHIPKIFAIDGKQPRVVFDFPDTITSDIINQIIETNGKFIKRIRIGIHEKPEPKTRVVFDLLPDQKIDFDHQFNNESNTLVITVFHAGSQPEEKATVSTAKTGEVTEEALKKEKAPAKTPEVEKIAAQPATGKKEENIRKFATGQPPEKPIKKEEVEPEPEVVASIPPPDKKPAVQAPPVDKPVEKKPAKAGIEPPTLTDKPDRVSTQKGTTPVLHSIEFDNTSNRGEMVLFQLNDFYPPIVFGIEEGSPRVVCDFMNTRIDPTVKQLIESKGRHVQYIRTARHQNPDKVRVVIDLRPKNNYDLQQVFFKEENLFVLIINTIKDKNQSDGQAKKL